MGRQSSLFAKENDTDVRAFNAYVRVVVERPLTRKGSGTLPDSALDALTYGVHGPPPPVGARVIVPLGRGKGTCGGYVLRVGGAELLEGLAPHRVRAVAHIEPLTLPHSLIELAQWIAGYYVAPLGVVLSSIVPAPVKHRTGSRTDDLVSPVPGFDPADADARASRLLSRVHALDDREFPMNLRELASRVEVKTLAPLRRLITLGALQVRTGEVIRARALDGVPRADAPTAQPHSLTTEQRHAVTGMRSALGAFSVHLLHGVTGSGKTEVYLQVIEDALSRGRGAIVLVPEIALTPQTAERFTSRLGAGTVAVLHSGLTPAQRHAQWDRCARGAARVVVGARSCVFAPVRDVGVIVVDEEHDASYKQDQSPRYHGRDVAIKRAQLERCPCILGSATPSMESWHNATTHARYALWTLRSRATGASMPIVRVVDMRDERRALAETTRSGTPPRRLLGPTLTSELDRTLHEGGQAMLLLNRRGVARSLICPSPVCGFALMCEQCDARLVLHKARVGPEGFVRCHRCLAEQRVLRLCPSCGRPLIWLGAGTQKLEDELASAFAHHGLALGTTMIRVDADSMRTARDFHLALGRFAAGEARVLLGTQMIAKGLDFPGVRLVGVVDADTSLSIPDFRAGERTFQLISQISGRAGRAGDGSPRGLVIVQAEDPHAAPIVLAAEHKFEEFARQELESRARHGLPPATRMARVICRDASAEKARERAKEVARLLHEAQTPGVRIVGPMECAIARISGQWRWCVEIITPGAASMRDVLAHARARGVFLSDARAQVDVDPTSLM